LVHIRRGKGHKDRFVPLPDLTYQALRALWCKHRNPCWFAPLRGANRGIELTLECLVAPLRSANQSFERTSLRLHESLRLSQARAFAQFRD
jgi:integrase